MLGRNDVERIVENMLKELTIKVRPVKVGMSYSDERVAELLYKGEVISYTYFDVKQIDE